MGVVIAIGERMRALTRRPPHWTEGLSRFARAHALGVGADALVDVSLASSLFFSISADASRQQVLLYLIVNLVPFTFLAPLIGPAIDRFPGSHRFIATAVFITRAILVVGLAFTLFDLGFYFFALALLIVGKATGIIKQALVPSLVDDPAHLVSANSSLARISLIVGSIVAPSAAIIVTFASEKITLALGCAGFLLAAFFSTRLPDQPPVADDELSADFQLVQLQTSIVTATAWAFMLIRAAVGFFVFGVVFALRRDSAPAIVYGAAAAAWGAGTFAGNILAPVLRRHTSEDRLTTYSLMGLAVAASICALGPSRLTLMLVAAVLGIAASLGRQGFDALLQSRSPHTKRGSAFARFETQFQFGWVVGAIAATASGMSVRVAMITIVVCVVPTAVFYGRNMIEARRAGVTNPFDPVGIASRRIEKLTVPEREEHARIVAIELGSVADLTLAAGHEIDAELAGRIDRLRRAAISGPYPEPDIAELDATVDEMRGVLADIERSMLEQARTEAASGEGPESNASNASNASVRSRLRWRRAAPRTSP